MMPIFQLMREVSPHMMKIFLHLYCLISSLVLGGERPHVVVCEAVSTVHVLKVSSGDNLMHHMRLSHRLPPFSHCLTVVYACIKESIL